MELAFQELPQQYETLLNSIEDVVIRKIYAQFTFHFYFIKRIDVFIEDQDIFINFLKNFKFITYYINNKTSLILQNQPNPKIKTDIKQIFQFSYAVFCVEGKCLIIPQISIPKAIEIIEELKKHNISMIDASENYNYKPSQDHIKEEIENFCSYFKSEILRNDFVRLTISSIACYMIRRFFYPTDYFIDKSFFSFDEMIIKEQNMKKMLMKVVFSKLDEDDYEKNEDDENCFKGGEEESINDEVINYDEEAFDRNLSDNKEEVFDSSSCNNNNEEEEENEEEEMKENEIKIINDEENLNDDEEENLNDEDEEKEE